MEAKNEMSSNSFTYVNFNRGRPKPARLPPLLSPTLPPTVENEMTRLHQKLAKKAGEYPVMHTIETRSGTARIRTVPFSVQQQTPVRAEQVRASMLKPRKNNTVVSYTISEDRSEDRGNCILSRFGKRKCGSREVSLKVISSYASRLGLRDWRSVSTRNVEEHDEQIDSEAESIVLPASTDCDPFLKNLFSLSSLTLLKDPILEEWGRAKDTTNEDDRSVDSFEHSPSVAAPPGPSMEQQNNLERRKQEEQLLIARQREYIAQQQVSMKQMQMSGIPGALHHHSSAHSLQSQPSFGSMTSKPSEPPSTSHCQFDSSAKVRTYTIYGRRGQPYATPPLQVHAFGSTFSNAAAGASVASPDPAAVSTISGPIPGHYADIHRQPAEMALNGNTGLASPPNGQKESFFSHLRKRARQGAAIPTATLSLKSQEMKRRGPRESHEGAEAQRALPRKRLKNISHVAPPQHMGHHGGMGGHGGGRMSGSGGVVPLRAGDWKCGSEGCGYHNFAKNVSCLRCGASRAGADGAYAHDASGTSAIHRGRLNASRSLYTEPQYELLQPHERKRVGGKRQKSRNLKYSDHTRSSFTNAPIPPRPLRSYHDSLAGRPW